ncbi:MAG: thiamine diphosphokinase [Alphaproteobacteria bacterium]|nr:thiamine diphosphokinase [Alphaproteobacteria bacterium]
MTVFALLLGGNLTVTRRLRQQLDGARIIAADSGMMHATSLGIVPELWVGDFDSAGSELAIQYREVDRESFPAEKDATDGSIAVDAALRRGATRIILAGGLGGQTDHTVGLLGQALRLALDGIDCLATSGEEEAYPLHPGVTVLDLPAESRLSLVPFSDLSGLGLDGVKWPLKNRDVPLGSTLTLSNVVRGPVRISLRGGAGIAFAYPPAEINV